MIIIFSYYELINLYLSSPEKKNGTLRFVYKETCFLVTLRIEQSVLGPILYSGEYRSKLVHFESQKLFCMLKSPCLEQFLP
jgi:hypothetical protein